MASGRAMGKLLRDRRGAAAVEYGLVASLVVVAILAALQSFGQANFDIWTKVATKVIAAG